MVVSNTSGSTGPRIVAVTLLGPSCGPISCSKRIVDFSHGSPECPCPALPLSPHLIRNQVRVYQAVLLAFKPEHGVFRSALQVPPTLFAFCNGVLLSLLGSFRTRFWCKLQTEDKPERGQGCFSRGQDSLPYLWSARSRSAELRFYVQMGTSLHSIFVRSWGFWPNFANCP